MSDFPTLTLLILLPLAGAAAVAVIPRRRSELVFPTAVATSMLPLAVAGYVVWEFATGEAGFQFTEKVLWFEPWGVSYFVGVDGISLLLVALTAFLVPISLLASASISDRRKEYFVAMLVLETGLLGTFLALDLLLFFVFFEVALVPMYLIIGLWGGEHRVYAAVKFFLYTALGSGLMLAGILSLGLIAGEQTGSATFDYTALLALDLPYGTQVWLFLAFGAAFAIKVPLFPFHTWLPDAHVEAPTAGSIILAGVLLKLGTYGFIRFNLALFPDATVDMVPVMVVLAVIGIIYGAVVAIVQPDLKRLVAYSSVSHLGFVVLGIFALTRSGLQGGVIQMVNHGLTTGALFLLVGMIYERRHTRLIADYGGIAAVMPWFAGAFLFVAFASIGLPGLNGFVGEFLVLTGSYLSVPAGAIVAAFGVVLAAIYLLWAYERVFTGPITHEENKLLADLAPREWAALLPMVALIIYLGVYPKPALDRIEPSVDALLERIEQTTDYVVPEFGSSQSGGEG
ncbi:MAG: NADH-quinone oxidoreductase subunit M [Acidimicrobiia bacterium]|nr:NADH-quinone oxidoreductase subunit M [Acidimicrobiia bacterium]